MIECYDCNCNWCFSGKSMFFEDYIKAKWVSAIFYDQIVLDLLTGINTILIKENSAECNGISSEYIDWSILEIFEDIIIEEYLKGEKEYFCYMYFARLLDMRYPDVYTPEIKKLYKVEEYYIYMLIYIYGEPYKEGNYLSYLLNDEDIYFKKHLESENKYFKEKLDKQKQQLEDKKLKNSLITKLINILKIISNSGKFLELKYGNSQSDIYNKCTSKRIKIVADKRNPSTQINIKKELMKIYGGCIICRIKRESLLEFAHIKPEVDCTEEEKLMITNGLIMCRNHHKLFDDKLFCINEDGTIFLSKNILEDEKEGLQFNKLKRIAICEGNIPFLRYRKNMFYGSENMI